MVMYVSGIADLMRITIAHTPDPDDAFMFYAMLEGILQRLSGFRGNEEGDLPLLLR